MKIYYFDHNCLEKDRAYIKYAKGTSNRYFFDNYDNKITGIVITQTSERYITDGVEHNVNGPAAIFKDGDKEYFYNGKFLGTNLTDKEFKQKLKELVFK